MSRRRLWLLAGLMAIALFLAFFLQEVIHRVVVVPLAYLWWIARYYYGIFPQMFLWVVLVLVSILIVASSLIRGLSFARARSRGSEPVEGPVEGLAHWMAKTKRGNYYKWRVANRLGKLARALLDRGQGSTNPQARLRLEMPASGEAVRRYLEAGVNDSFVDYPQPPFFGYPRRATPFDLDLGEVVEFLESRMEEISERKHA